MPIHVVNIEDDRPLRDILRVAFQVVDPYVKLHQFTSGDEALPYIEQNGQTIDLFVLDIRLPGTMNGIEVAQKIRERNYPGRIVVTSAFSAPSPELLNSLNIEYFPKPWHIMDLTHKLFQQRVIAPAANMMMMK